MKVFDKLFKKGADGGDLPELAGQRKISYPGYRDGEFASLGDAVRYFKKNRSSLEYRIPDMIMFNVCYRDYLRSYGMETLMRRLLKDIPELAEDPLLLQRLREWYEKKGKDLARYDIQCYNIKDTITVLGHTFHGLEDVIAHRTAFARIGHSDISIGSCSPKKHMSGLHVSEFYANYPIFDSYDIGDDRTYQNYVFTNEIIDNVKLKEISEIDYNYNYCMVHERIPERFLPILYYRGDGDYMILAQKK